MTTTEFCHPQTLVDTAGHTADAGIAPLVAMVIRHGLSVRQSCQGGGGSGIAELAYVHFPAVEQALEFLLHVGHNSGYRLADQIALTVHRPMIEGEGPGGRVSWLPELTEHLTAAWREGLC